MVALARVLMYTDTVVSEMCIAQAHCAIVLVYTHIISMNPST